MNGGQWLAPGELEKARHNQQYLECLEQFIDQLPEPSEPYLDAFGDSLYCRLLYLVTECEIKSP